MATEQAILSKISQILAAPSVDALWTDLLAILKSYGFDRVMYVSTQFGSEQHWGNKADWLMLTNHHPEVVDQFVREDLYRNGVPLFQPPDGVPGAYSWRRTRRRYTTDVPDDQQKRHRDMVARHGLTAGYTIWFANNNVRNRNVMGLCARPGLDQDAVDAFWQEQGGEIETLCNIAHLKLLSLPHPGLDRRLTLRQVQVLEHAADGKSGRDTADLMNLSLVTIEKHLRQSREALGVETTAEAVQKLAKMNHLFLARRH